MRLATLAADILRDPLVQPAAHVAVAVSTLSAAVRERIEVPLNVAAALWTAIERSPTASWTSDASEAVGLIADRSLVERILTAVTRHDASKELRAAGLDALGDAKAAKHLTDSDVFALVDVTTGRALAGVASVVHGVSEGRHLDPAPLTLIVDRWVSSSDIHARHAALEIVELLPSETAGRVIERLLRDDPAPAVRETAAMVLVDVLDPHAALLLVDEALAWEERADVRSALGRARVDLLAKAP